MEHFTTLIDTATLARQRDRADLALFDCRFELGNTVWGEREYAAAHLPGAHYLHLDRDLSAPVSEHSGRHPLPDPHVFANTLAMRGVGTGCQLIAYDQGNGVYASRLWWMARWIGLEHVAVLDGGIAAWRAAGLPLTQEVPTPVARELPVHVNADAWLTTADVDALRGQPGHLLIDARGADRFAGRNETIDPVAGHIPGARNHPIAGNLGVDNRFLGADTLRQRWSTVLGSLPASSLVAMCGSGVTACHNLLALEHAGLKGARLYPGSWSEWIRVPSRPRAVGAC
jgi:thiosulfate/3-mercaptopyruvate sulfurtransferase